MAAAMVAGLLAGSMTLPTLAAQKNNFTDDMKITGVEKITQDQGAASIERKLDHKNPTTMPIRIFTICIPKDP